MHQSTAYLNEFLTFFMSGLVDGFAHVNAALGLIIALIAARQLSSLKRLWAVALAATIAHLLAEVLIPVLDNRANFRLPRDLLTGHYWHTALALYLGYLLVIALFYAIKRAVMPRFVASH